MLSSCETSKSCVKAVRCVWTLLKRLYWILSVLDPTKPAVAYMMADEQERIKEVSKQRGVDVALSG